MKSMKPQTQANKLTLITSGTGKTGRRVAMRLEERSLPIRIGSRSGNPAFDWTNPTTWVPALKGVDAVYVTYQPDLAFPGAAATVRAFADVAIENGVRRLILLSGRGEDGALLAEQAIRESGAAWTIVRASWFYQNFSEHFLLDAVRSGEVAFPGGRVAEPFVDADDIADIVVAALTDDRHVGQLYEVTGPRLLTFNEAVGEIAQATGRDIQYLAISPADYQAGMIEHGIPRDIAELLSELFATVLDGRNTFVTDGIQRALGRAPRDFAQYAKTTAATGVWNVNR